MISVKTTRKELSFHIKGQRVSYDKETLVKDDSVVKNHIKDGSLVMVERKEILNKKEKKVKNVEY